MKMQLRSVFVWLLAVSIDWRAARAEDEPSEEEEASTDAALKDLSDLDLGALEDKFAAVVFGDHGGNAAALHAAYDRNGDGSLGHGEAAKLMKDAGVTMKDGGRHEWAQVLLKALDSDRDGRVIPAEVAPAHDLFRAARGGGAKASGGLGKFAARVEEAAARGDVEGVRALFAGLPHAPLVEAWRGAAAAAEAEVNNALADGPDDLVTKYDSRRGRKKDGALDRGELKGLLKKRKLGNPLSRHLTAVAALKALDCDGDGLVAVAELARAHAAFNAATAKFGSVYQAAHRAAFAPDSLRWHEFVAAIPPDTEAARVATGGWQTAGEIWSVIEAWLEAERPAGARHEL